MAGRRNRAGIAFMAVWLAFWTASIFVVLWTLGAAALRGDFGAAPFLVIWLGFAGLGLYAGVRRMQTLLGLARPPGPPSSGARHDWDDALPERPDG